MIFGHKVQKKKNLVIEEAFNLLVDPWFIVGEAVSLFRWDDGVLCFTLTSAGMLGL